MNRHWTRRWELWRNWRTILQLVVTTSHLNSSNVPFHMLLKHYIRCSSVYGALSVSLWSARMVSLSLYKGKGPKNECSSYRPISLRSVPGKVFSHVLLERIQPLLQMTKSPQQSGFTAGHSTIDDCYLGSMINIGTLPTLHISIICWICRY